MDILPEHKLVFLNELHETLKRLDPRRVQNAGLFRILGKLVECDMDSQIVKVESCFHHEYTVEPIILPATARRRKRNKGTGALKHGYQRSSKPGPGGRTRQDGGEESLKSAGDDPRGTRSHTDNNSTTIDLTLDDDDDVEMHEQGQDVVAHSSSNDQNETHEDSCVDLTVSTDDDEQDDDQGMVSSPSDHEEEHIATVAAAVTNRPPRRAPKVVLWVDTQLLGSRLFEPNALFQFMGEVVYYQSTATTTASDKDGGWRGGHWVLQARTARLMDGLDLYSYRQAILLTRELVQQQRQQRQQRQREQDREKEKLAEEEQSGQE
ncbi:hypothetical protein BGX33_001682 [Mortierella sp. NVP41]|nr:hypothetical protein BGX33_001682 [Mortierella sp. NVP41]